jgi:predicted RNase H-like HicB family nuclease
MMKYTVVVEKSESGFGAFVPDIPDCIAAAETKAQVLTLIKEAIEFHIEGLIEDGETVPAPSCDFAQVEVHAA